MLDDVDAQLQRNLRGAIEAGVIDQEDPVGFAARDTGHDVAQGLLRPIRRQDDHPTGSRAEIVEPWQPHLPRPGAQRKERDQPGAPDGDRRDRPGIRVGKHQRHVADHEQNLLPRLEANAQREPRAEDQAREVVDIQVRRDQGRPNQADRDRQLRPATPGAPCRR